MEVLHTKPSCFRTRFRWSCSVAKSSERHILPPSTRAGLQTSSVNKEPYRTDPLKRIKESSVHLPHSPVQFGMTSS